LRKSSDYYRKKLSLTNRSSFKYYFIFTITKEKTMNWDKAAEKAQEMLPIPPMMAPFARLQSEKIARRRGLNCVTTEVVNESARVYRDFMGKEKTEELQAFLEGRGPAPAMEDELFFSNDNALYHIDLCYTKYGENTREVRTILKDMLRSVTALCEEVNLTEIMADLAPVALHGASRFSMVMTGCPNCCVSPYLKDFGIIMQHRVDITDAECTQCGACLKMCFDQAITLTEKGPVIDRSKCAMCELCARDCPTGKLVTGARGFLVVAGGTGARRSKLALPLESFTTKERVLAMLRKAISKLRHAQAGETLRTIIEREGAEVLR
jgi:Fe-S-cluster-containing hydrogenase component 2